MKKLATWIKRISPTLGVIILFALAASSALALTLTQNNDTLSLISQNSDDSEKIAQAQIIAPIMLISANNDNDGGSTVELNQLQSNSNISNITRELDMEANGITKLSDTGSKSESHKDLMALIKKYQEIIKLDPNNVQVWLKLANAWETIENNDNALAAFKQVLIISSENITAIKGIERINTGKRIKLKFYWSHIVQDEYSPVLQADLSSWKEDIKQVQVSKSLGPGKNISFGWLESNIVQENHYYNDVDFSLHREAPFFHIQFPVTNQISALFRVRDEKFTNDSNKGYFQLEGEQHIYTGYLLLNYRAKDFWMNFNYSRERETDPIYDPIAARAVLNIEVKELTGISAGKVLNENWEIGSSIYYEEYGSSRENQFNTNAQISYLPGWMAGTRLSLGTGYYTEEKETIVNLAVGYNWQPIKKINLGLEYQLEYSNNEESWLNQGELIFSWYVFNRLSLTMRTSYGREYGGDEDEFFSIQIGPVLDF